MDKVCSIPECGPAKKIVKGYCNKHYKKYLKGQIPEIESPTWIDRYWKFVDKSPDDSICWGWLGAYKSVSNKRYGRVRIAQKGYAAHRVGWAIFKGIHPSELSKSNPIHHTCGNSLCQNPKHLQEITAIENTAEMLERTYYKNRIIYLEKILDQNGIEYDK